MENKKIKKYAVPILILLVIGIGIIYYNVDFNYTGKVINKENVKIKIGYLPSTHALPLYMGIEKGWFEEEGIDVEIIKFQSPNQLIDALLQNKIDFASAAANGIVGIVETKNPGKLKVISVSGGTKEIPSVNFLVPLNSDIKSIKDLKGKKIGNLGGTIQWQTIIKDLLEKNGLDVEKDVTIIELTPGLQVPALATKQIDALLALEPMSTNARLKGVGKIFYPGPVEELIADPFYGGADVVNVNFAKKNPETTKKVVKIYERTYKEIRENPKDSKKYLKDYTALDEGLIQETPLMVWKSYDELTKEDLKSIQAFYDIFTKHGVVDKEINPEDVLYSPIIKLS